MLPFAANSRLICIDAAMRGSDSGGAPEPWPYYGCFVRALDGNKIEATSWDLEKARAPGM
jgi:hypothetical protein